MSEQTGPTTNAPAKHDFSTEDGLTNYFNSLGQGDRHVPVWVHPNIASHLFKAFGHNNSAIAHPGVKYPEPPQINDPKTGSRRLSSAVAPMGAANNDAPLPSPDPASFSPEPDILPNIGTGQPYIDPRIGPAPAGTPSQPNPNDPSKIVPTYPTAPGVTADGTATPEAPAFTSPLGSDYTLGSLGGNPTYFDSYGYPRATSVNPAADPYGLSGGETGGAAPDLGSMGGMVTVYSGQGGSTGSRIPVPPPKLY